MRVCIVINGYGDGEHFSVAPRLALQVARRPAWILWLWSRAVTAFRPQNIAQVGRTLEQRLLFLVAVTWRDELVRAEMGSSLRQGGLNSFKHLWRGSSR